MSLTPIKLPPGLLKNSTPYQKAGRWVAGNLIRWRDRTVYSMSGWLQRVPTQLVANPAVEVCRDLFSWKSNAQDQHIVAGTNLKLYHISQSNTVTDITPSGVTTTGKEPVTVAGYGKNPFGAGAFGAANDLVAQDPLPPQRWGFSTFGEVLLTIQHNTGPVYAVNPATLAVTVVAAAPSSVADITVTDQRIVMTVGGSGAPRQVKWSDQEDYTDWTPTVANQAGDKTLTGAGALLRAVPVLGKVVVVSETDAHLASYLGAPFVFGFSLLGRNCGPYGAWSVIGTDKFVAWWGKSAFWVFDGSLQQLPCAVMEFLTTDVNSAMVTKISAMSMHQHSEIWWLYQSNTPGVTEVDSYVIWDYVANTWNCGRLARTAGLDAGVTRHPLMVCTNSVVYAHEQEGVTPVGDVFVETGPLDIASGDVNLAISSIVPDTAVADQVTVTAFAKQVPTGQDLTFGPYPYASPTPTRIIGKEVRLRYTKVPGAQAMAVGDMRIDVVATGTGRR